MPEKIRLPSMTTSIREWYLSTASNMRHLRFHDIFDQSHNSTIQKSVSTPRSKKDKEDVMSDDKYVVGKIIRHTGQAPDEICRLMIWVQ